MSFAGSVQAMITSLKNNARPKRKAFSALKNHNPILKKTGKLKRKKIPDEQLKIVIDKIRLDAKTERRKDNIRITLIISFMILLFFILFNFGIKDTILRFEYSAEKKLKLEQERSITDDTETFYMQCLNKGFDYMYKADYKNAKQLLYKAYKLKPDEFNALFLYTKACVLDCKDNNSDCESAKKTLDFLSYKYPKNNEVIILQELFEN